MFDNINHYTLTSKFNPQKNLFEVMLAIVNGILKEKPA